MKDGELEIKDGPGRASPSCGGDGLLHQASPAKPDYLPNFGKLRKLSRKFLHFFHRLPLLLHLLFSLSIFPVDCFLLIIDAHLALYFYYRLCAVSCQSIFNVYH